MKAIYIEHHGAIEDLRASEVPVPSIGPGDVLVKIEASGINPSDLGIVQGRFPVAVLPRIVGRDFAGKVVEGPADVVGTEVWGTGGDLGISRDGTHAEYVAIPREAVARGPKNLSMEEASAVGVPFVTAFSALVRVGQLKEGEWVIVSGARVPSGKRRPRSPTRRVLTLSHLLRTPMHVGSLNRARFERPRSPIWGT